MRRFFLLKSHAIAKKTSYEDHFAGAGKMIAGGLLGEAKAGPETERK